MFFQTVQLIKFYLCIISLSAFRAQEDDAASYSRKPDSLAQRIQLSEFFNSVDQDADGQVEREEAIKFLQDLGGSEYSSAAELNESVQQFFGAVDSPDHDLSVDTTEFEKYLADLMTTGSVVRWITHGLQLPQYAEAFRVNAVTAFDFPMLVRTDALEVELGVASGLHRQQLLRAMKKKILGQGKLPGIPEGPSCTGVTPTSVVLQWSAPAAPGSPPGHLYEIERRSQVSPIWQTFSIDSQHDTFLDESVKRHEIYDYRVVMWSSTGQSDYAYVEGCTGTQGAWLVDTFWLYHSSTRGISTLLLALLCLVGALSLRPSSGFRGTSPLRSDADLYQKNSLRKRPKEGLRRRASAGEAMLPRRKSSTLVSRQSKLQKRAASEQNLNILRGSLAAVHESNSHPDVQRALPEEPKSTCEDAAEAWAKIMADEDVDDQQLEPSGTDTSGAATPVGHRESSRGIKSKSMSNNSDIKSWEIDEASIKMEKCIGSGASGQVWLGSMDGNTEVAIKQFSQRGPFFDGREEDSKQLEELEKEAQTLANLHHPSILRFYGVMLPTKSSPYLAVVTEYCKHGTLRNFLKDAWKEQGGDTETTPRALRVKLLLDAALGMRYLHQNNVVHCDLKCQNLLVTGSEKKPKCRVADFGLSMQRPNSHCSLPTLKEMVGTPCFMAPEVIDFERPSGPKVDELVDVFSFGMVMWEALTGQFPFEDMMQKPYSYIQIPNQMKENNLRPTVPSACEADYRQLMEECWDGDKTKRPDFGEIVKRLKLMK